ncbi:MAG: hypothetical protein JWN09_144 [Microbacteriaceae bacterium]|jgi:hypothetical protein|nr:hypothetical protein [Microbacteriaceae bacterium]
MILGGPVTVDGQARRFTVRIRPKPTLIRSGLLMLLIVPLPIFAALLFLGLSSGSWPIAVIGEALCMLLCWLGLVMFRATFVGVTTTSIVEHGFFGRATTAPLSEVASVVLAHTYSTSTTETLPQLIVRDRNGVRLLRLRGIFWTEESMRVIADSIGGDLELPPEAMTSAEFFDRYAGSAYWFENRPVVAGVGIAVLLAVCVGVVLGLMRLLGQPMAGS